MENGKEKNTPGGETARNYGRISRVSGSRAGHGLFIITFILQAFEIPSSSMEDTLLIGDHVFVNRCSFPAARWMGPLLPYREIKRGDIVVFLSPAEPGLYVVKRIIGIPGDRIHLRDGVVYRNGEKLNEPYVMHQGPSLSTIRTATISRGTASDIYNVPPTGSLPAPAHRRATISWCPRTVISAWATTAM